MPIIIILVPLLAILALFLILLYSTRFKKIDPKIHFLSDKNDFLQSLSADLSPHIRRYVFIAALIWGLSVLGFLYIISFDKDEFLKGIVRIYGFTSLFLIFLTLTPGMIRTYFPAFILDSLLIKSRRALGICTFIFGFIHGTVAFLYYFSGSMQRISSLPLHYQLAAYFAIAALFIFAVMAITSSDKIVEILGFQKWKIIHRFIYLAFLLSLLHSFIRGTHLNEPFKTFSAIMVFFSLTFVLLEIGSTIAFVFTHNSSKTSPKNLIIFTILGVIGIAAFYLAILKLDQLY